MSSEGLAKDCDLTGIKIHLISVLAWHPFFYLHYLHDRNEAYIISHMEGENLKQTYPDGVGIYRLLAEYAERPIVTEGDELGIAVHRRKNRILQLITLEHLM